MGRAHVRDDHRQLEDPDAVTEAIPLPRPSWPPSLPAQGPAPAALVAGGRDRARQALVWATAALAVFMLATSAVVVVGTMTTPADVAAAPVPSATGPGPVASTAPSAGGSSLAPPAAGGSACPSEQEVLDTFARAAPQYGAGALATSGVRCAGGFAVMSLRSASTPDGLRTIYAIGPPLRHLGSGTSPVCSDDGSEGVTVPRSAASALDCVTGGTSGPSGQTPSSGAASSGEPEGAGSASGADPFGCLAEREAQERSFDTEEPMSNAELKCSYNYGPTLPSSREQCWLAHHDLQDGSGFIDERARRDYESGCSRFGY